MTGETEAKIPEWIDFAEWVCRVLEVTAISYSQMQPVRWRPSKYFADFFDALRHPIPSKAADEGE